ncbi:MAG: 2OG-Fe(II) oxygenase family protein [Acidiferrobacterales bacterium]|nr:2OG-Fe(II) oxygenase family protein [Acidiferrobacterales bacterium]
MAEKQNNQIPPLLGYFSTPFYRVLAGHGEQLGSLREFLLAKAIPELENPDSPQQSHSAVFESAFDLFNWQGEEVQAVKGRLHGHLMNYLRLVNNYTEEQLKELNFRTESWFHVTTKGGYFQSHTHPLASVSMIYCVDPGDAEIADLHESGQVLFTDPRANASMYLDPANRYMTRPFSFDGIRFRLQPDEVCIFPSYLQHSVEPYNGEDPRITIAANFSFGLK